MRIVPRMWDAAVVATLMAPFGALAQFLPTPYHTFDIFSPNSLNFTPGPRVNVGAFLLPGVTGTATRNPAEICSGPLTVALDNLASLNVPHQANARYFPATVSDVCVGSWALTLQAGTLQASATTQTLNGIQVLPFVSNISQSSSADGKVHVFTWSGALGVDSVGIQVWDRSQIASGGMAQFVAEIRFVGAATSFTIDLNQIGSRFANDRRYAMEVQQVILHDPNAGVGFANARSRSRTFFDFVLPSIPLTTEPVFLPIVEFIAGDPTYTFTVSVDAAGTFVIDPDIAVGYVYRTGVGSPNFRSVKLPNVGDGSYLVELFDSSTASYRKRFTALAGQTYDFAAQGFAQGVAKFRVKGIESAANLDPTNATAFPTGLGFTAAGTFTGSMVPISKYTFSGFLPPINLPPTVNTRRAGRSFPVKWTLADRLGDAVTDRGAVEAITYKPSACAPFTTDPVGGLNAVDRASRLRFDGRAQQYVFDWKSPKAPGCYALFVKFDTGQVFTANFMLQGRRERDDDG